MTRYRSPSAEMQPDRRRFGGLRRVGRRTALGSVVTLVAGLLPVVTAPAALADDWLNRPANGVFSVNGHGEGHGRGMSQYGAQGAALQGYTSSQILDFYYRGSVSAAVDPARLLRVWISADNDGFTEVVRSADLEVRDVNTGAVIPTPANAQQVRSRVSGTGFAVDALINGTWQNVAGGAAAQPAVANAQVPGEDAATSYPAANPEGPSAAEVAAGAATGAQPEPPQPSTTPDSSPTSAAPAAIAGAEIAAAAAVTTGPVSFRATMSGVVEVVVPSGDRYGYRGEVRAVRNGSSAVTVDVVPLSDYVRAVVPRESPSYWEPAALEAQSIAARTYATAYRSTNGNFDICDTAACQVYGGATLNGAARETARTDAAVRATAGLIRTYGGSPINAQFGSTNGGWTVDGGVPYLPAQRDPFEAVAKPPQSYANWTGTLTVASLESRFPGIGSFTRLRITQRDGNGDWGGRVVSAVVEGTAGSRTVTGDQLRLAVSAPVRSTYFQVSDPDAGSLPIGNVDRAVIDGSVLRVSGWALDPNEPTNPTSVHVYDYGPNGTTAVQLTADGNRPDVAAVLPSAGSAHGFSAAVPVSGRGAHRVCVFAINLGPGRGNTLLRCLDLVVGPPFGVIDAVGGGRGNVTVRGWSVDPAVPTASTQVHVYDTGPNGTAGHSGFTADLSRPDIAAAYPGSGNSHGFDITVPVTGAGLHNLCAFAISVVPGGPNSLLGCRSVLVANPVGSLDAVTVAASGIRVSGWALSPALPTTPLDVHTYITGPTGRTVGHAGTVAGDSRPDVGEVFPGTGTAHGFNRVLPAGGSGANQVCVFAISAGPSTGNTLLGCRTVTVP